MSTEPRHSASSPLILVAEDNPQNQALIRRQLARLGFTCHMVGTGREALAAYQTHRYGLLLTDIQMPEMDGYELCDAIGQHANLTGGRAPVIAITANDVPATTRSARLAPPDDYLTKPLQLGVLDACLRRWLPPSVLSEKSSQPGVGLAGRAEEGIPIDEGTLSSVIGDDPVLAREILQGFIAPARVALADIAGAVTKANAGGVKASAHKLKSSARAIGGHALADCLQALETAAHTEAWPAINAHAQCLPALLTAIEGYVASRWAG